MMLSADFVQFINPGVGKSARTYNGYLSFLTVPPGRPPQTTIAHRSCTHEHFYWLEVKDEIQQEAVNIQLEPAEPCLWIAIALMGDCAFRSVTNVDVASGNRVCFANNRRALQLTLKPGKNWQFLAGFGQSTFEALSKEFPFLASLRRLEADVTHHWVGREERISTRLRNILESLQRLVFRSFSTPIQLAGWSLRLLNYFFQENATDEAEAGEQDDISRYHQATRFIQEHYQDDINLEKVAAELNVSVRNLTRCFEHRPYTVNGYISHLRLTKARELLVFSDRSIQDIAYALRFSCPKYFSNTFKQKFKKSPKAYRDEMKTETLGLNRRAITPYTDV